jgi:hypothetical protein
VDQIFDRFERLFKSWVNSETENLFGSRSGSHPGIRSSGDPDLDAAMSELDDFLDRDRTETEKKEAERERREREEAARRSRGDYGYTGSSTRPAGPHPKLVQAYRRLGLAYGTPFPEVKAAYKKLLMANHPDRNSATPEQLKRSTEISALINEAYNKIEIWNSTGKVTED